MAKNNTFIGSFKDVLEAIPENFTLAEWEYLYRSVIFAMGMKILETFPEAAVAPNPFEGGRTALPLAKKVSAGSLPGPRPAPPPPPPMTPSSIGGPGGGIRPHVIVFAEFVLGLDPPPPPQS